MDNGILLKVRALRRCRELAEKTGKSLEEIVLCEGSHLDELLQADREYKQSNNHENISSIGKTPLDATLKKQAYKIREMKESSKYKVSRPFKRTHEFNRSTLDKSTINFKDIDQISSKKEDEVVDMRIPEIQEKEERNVSQQTHLFGAENMPQISLNKLASRAIKAKLKKDMSTYNRLMDEVKAEKRRLSSEIEKENTKKYSTDTVLEAKDLVQNISNTDCWFCMNSKKFKTHLLIDQGNYVYLCMKPSSHALFPGYHFSIVPYDHVASIRCLDESAYEEIQQYKSQLYTLAHTIMDSMHNAVIFIETVIKSHKYQHCSMDAIFVPREIIQDCEYYFKLGLTGEDVSIDNNNTTLIELKPELNQRFPLPSSGKFSYFFVQWSTIPVKGYLKIIENNELSTNFAEEVIRSIMKIETLQKKESHGISTKSVLEQDRKLVSKFKALYLSFEE